MCRPALGFTTQPPALGPGPFPSGWNNHFTAVTTSSYEIQNIVTCPGFAWLIITGSGLDDSTYWHFFHNYTQLWQFTVNDCLRLAPFLPGLRVSSLLLWRTTNEVSFEIEHSWNELTSRRTECRLPSPIVCVFLCFIRCHGNMCLANRCLAMVIFFTVLLQHRKKMRPRPGADILKNYVYKL
jgi:hypothetical protein